MDTEGQQGGTPKFSAISLPWLSSSFAWLVVSGILGLWESLPSSASLLGWHLDVGNVGTVILARHGAFNYGWAGMATIALVMYCIRPHVAYWHTTARAMAWCWNVIIACGTLSVLGGYGSGMAVMPFAPWILLPLIVVAGVIHFMIWSEGGIKGLGVIFPAFLSYLLMECALILILFGANGGVNGIGGMSGMSEIVLMTCVHVILIASAVTIALTALWLAALAIKGRVMPRFSILLGLIPLAACCCAGTGDLVGFPVSETVMQWGIVARWILAIDFVILGAVGLSRLLVKRASLLPTVRFWMGASLLMMLGWGIAQMVFHGEAVFSSMSSGQWYVVELILFCSLGLLLRAAWHLCLHGEVSVGDYSWGLGCLFLWITYGLHVYFNAGVEHLPLHLHPDFIQRALCEGAAIASVFALLAWIFLIIAAGVSWRSCIKGESSMFQDTSPTSDGRPFSVMRGCVGLILVILVSGTALQLTTGLDDSSAAEYGSGSGAGAISGVETKRPGESAEGSHIYATLGCGVCHTQIVRRCPSGADLQREIDSAGMSGGIVRVSEPEDFSPSMREGIAHAGWAMMGPDLTNLRARLEQKLSYMDAKGNARLMASPEEWLYLHLYNPREPQFKKEWSSCPALPELFEMIPRAGAQASPNALPVQTQSGYDLVPTRKARALVAYLMTLVRGEVTRGDGTALTTVQLESRPHVSKSYAQHPPSIDLSKIQQARESRIFQRGREIYLAKCSVCHGTEGLGDAVNYPPLLGSEWILKKEPDVLARIIRNGLTGKIQVKGRDWNSTMLPPGIGSSDELMPLMNYLRRAMNQQDGVQDEHQKRAKELPQISPQQADALWQGAVLFSH